MQTSTDCCQRNWRRFSPIIKLTRQFIKLQKAATKHKHKGTNVLNIKSLIFSDKIQAVKKLIMSSRKRSLSILHVLYEAWRGWIHSQFKSKACLYHLSPNKLLYTVLLMIFCVFLSLLREELFPFLGLDICLVHSQEDKN